MPSALIAFLGVAAVLICTPGQDTALTIRNTLAGGRRTGVSTAAGVALGQVAWSVAAAVGVASLVAAWRPAFVGLQLAGAAYLIVLGVLSLLAAFGLRRGSHGTEPVARPERSLRSGLLSNLANPKMALFFTSLLPQFAPEGRVVGLLTMLALGVLFSAMTFAWLSFYALVVDRARGALLRGRVRRFLDAVTGAVLVAFGVRVALAHDSP